MSALPAVELRSVAKYYGAVAALKPTSLVVQAGSYFVLLGPSGGGKTTTLRLIGGLIEPSAGQVIINGDDVTRYPANKRSTSMVFQNYALFPHMSVAQNISYGLRLRKLARSVIDERVGAMLDLVGLSGLHRRMPHELSGGQQQRVQLARSLILETAILLLDEPLAALDANLRKSMCFELKRIQDKVGITFIHVTHNQEEAMMIADRIAILGGGELIEEGSVRSVYENPERRFTAEFIGDNTVFDARVVAVSDGLAEVDLGFARVSVNCGRSTLQTNQAVALSIRPELARFVRATAPAAGLQRVPARLQETFYWGGFSARLVRFPNGQQGLVRSTADTEGPADNSAEPYYFCWQRDDARLHIR